MKMFLVARMPSMKMFLVALVEPKYLDLGL